MILFCEDCGEKNSVDGAALQGGRARFTCRECGYPNSYAIQVTEKVPGESLNRILATLLDVPDVIGAFFYHSRRGILASRMPAGLQQSDIDILGREFSRTYDQGISFFPDIQDMQILIADKYFYVHRTGAGICLVIVSRTDSLPRDISDLTAGLADQFPDVAPKGGDL